MKVVHLMVRGRVQGVGYRAWCAREASGLGLRGWVRNRRIGAVEAVLAGADAAVEAMTHACAIGPTGARVDDILVHEASETALAASGGDSDFVILDTL
ncbi:MAG: acylphosphatase [Pseudomonadota bacterium]